MDTIPNELSIAEARANLSEVLNAVRLQNRKVRLTRRGKPQASVIPTELDEAIDAVGGIDAAVEVLRKAAKG